MIKFNGISSGTLGVYVEKYPVRPVPQRKQEVFSVPGLSGDVIVAEDAWENVEQAYDIYLSAEAAGLPAVAGPAVAWLHGAKGYARLEDDYNPNVFRMAAFAGPADLANILNAFGRATISFNCKPQRFLKSGETPIVPGTVTDSGAVVTFDSDTAGASITDLSAEFHPAQSYNGYSKPWAGGTGKNLFNSANAYANTAHPYGLSIAISGDVVTISGTATGTGNLAFIAINYNDYSLSGQGYVVQALDWTGNKSLKNCYGFRTATEKNMAIVLDSVTTGDNVSVSFKVSVAVESQTEWSPYANICPITGHTGLTISQSGQDTSSPTDTAIDWSATAGTLYGGTLDVTTGALTATYGEIASYAGEALPGAWLSSLDEYTPGGTPTTGAQVVYELSSPMSYTIAGVAFVTLLGENNFWADTGDVTVTYPAGGASLVNPTGYPARPLITVHGSSSGTVTIGTQTVTISTITDGMVLDCDLEEAYSIGGGVVTNLNSVVSGSFPVLGPGESSMSWGGGVSGLSIIPRWYEL